jgi:hypothetical protein
MKSIKKFSAMSAKDQPITESAKVTKEAVDELIKKIGFDSIEELKKEKDLLAKLEAMSKTVAKSNDISEDEIEEDRAEDIEDEMKAKGTPKSLEGEGKEKEGEEEVIPSDSEVAEEEKAESDSKEVEEDRAEDIEDEVLSIGKPKSLEKDKGEVVSKDQEITKEVPDEASEVEDKGGVEVEDDDAENEEVETPKATRRIMAFEDFVKEKEMTINKNVKYHDDEEEKEDYAMPVAASADPLAEGYGKMEDDDDDDDEERGEEDERKGDEMEDKGDKKVDSEDDKEKVDHYKGAVKSDDKEIDALKKDVEYDEEEEEDAKKNESTIMSFATFVNEAYGKMEDEDEDEDEDEVKEKYDRVVLGGNKGDKSKTHSGEDYEKDEEEEDEMKEAYDKKEEYQKDEEEEKKEEGYGKMEDEEEDEVKEKYDRVVLGGNKGDKSKTHSGEDYEKDEEEEDEVKEKYDKVVLGGNKGDKSKTHSGEDYEKDEEEEEKKDEAVEEAVGEVITKVEGDEIKDEEAGDDGIAIPAIKGDGPETAAGIAGDMMDKGKPKSVEGKGKDLISKDQVITDVVKGEADDKADGTEIVKEEEVYADDSIAEKFRKLAEKKLGKVNEKEITNDADFKDYAMAILKDAHGDKFDEAKAMEVVDGLKDKYKGDYGAMVGALQATMGS